MNKLALGEHLALPVDAATQTFLIIGKRGSGKSNTAVRFAEQLHHAGVPWVAIDPVDNWWGIKASENGRAPGLAVYVFGGPHGDVPLESTAGALVADVVVEQRISVVLSVKHFSIRERGRFVADFTQRLFRINREPLHVFLEEAHEVAPQNPYKGEEEMLGHVTRIWKLGRSSGLGGSAITQRPASLSKNITTQAEVLIVHRTLGPQDVAAVREWIKYHGEREDILAELGTLKTGEAFVWAPDFPEGRPIGLKRVLLYQRETFDSAATPKAGERRVEPKKLADVDLEQLSAKMAATIEKAKAEDPRLLRAEIARLQGELKKKPVPATAVPQGKRVDVPVLKDSQVKKLVAHYERMLAEAERHGKAMSLLWEHQAQEAKALLDAIVKVSKGAPQSTMGAVVIRPTFGTSTPGALVTTTRPAHSPKPGPVDGAPLGRAPLAILHAAVQRYPRHSTRAQLAILSQYSVASSSFDNALGQLRSRALMQGAADDNWPTEEGIAAAGDVETPPTGGELLGWWQAKMGRAPKTLLGVIVGAGEGGLSREELSAKSGYSAGSSSFDNAIGYLRTIQLVHQGWPARASGEFFA